MTASAEIHTASDLRAEPQAPPRAPTPRSRRRAWTEPHVRFWWLAGLVFVAAALYFAIAQVREIAEESRLIRDGVSVDALVVTAAGEPVPGKSRPPESECELRFEYKGATYDVQGPLRGRKEWIDVGSKVPIRIDPNDPTHWTGRASIGTPSLSDWLTPLIIIAVALIVLAVAWVKRRRLDRLWRFGEAIPAVALDSRQTALAPRSRAVRVTTAAASGDDRVYAVFVPSAAPIAEGEMLWLLMPPDGHGPVAAALWFQ